MLAVLPLLISLSDRPSIEWNPRSEVVIGRNKGFFIESASQGRKYVQKDKSLGLDAQKSCSLSLRLASIQSGPSKTEVSKSRIIASDNCSRPCKIYGGSGCSL